MEIWKNFGEFYQVSNLGRVRSLDRTYISKAGKKQSRKGKILKVDNYQRYSKVSIYMNGRKQTFSVHRLVALAFIDNPENKPQVNHIDGNRKNNKVENLEWNTPSENNIHAYRTNLNKSTGERHPKTKLLKNEVEAIKLLHGIKTLEEMSKFFKVSKSTISAVYNNKTWKYES